MISQRPSSEPIGVRFSSREIRDLLIAWLALGVAFALFFGGGATAIYRPDFVLLFIVSFLTAGVGFLLHELAHKIVAVHYGQLAEFRADFGMLILAILTALAGFIFAAPGAVHHRGRITRRQHGLVALAGPLTNLLLALVFLPLLAASVDFLVMLGVYGVGINLLLAAFNMIPFGPLDGKTVIRWSKLVFLVVFVLAVFSTILFVFVIFL